MEKNLDDLEYSDDFLDTTSKAQSMKEIIDKLDFIQIKNFCSSKDTAGRLKIRTEKIFANTYLIKGCFLKHTENA